MDDKGSISYEMLPADPTEVTREKNNRMNMIDDIIITV